MRERNSHHTLPMTMLNAAEIKSKVGISVFIAS